MGLWAQTTILDPDARPLLALQRWFEALTLTSPVAAPRLVGLWAWLLGLGLLLIAAIVFQGPRAALRQLVDIPGHLRLLHEALRRLRNAGRLVAILLGGTILAWTITQSTKFASERRLQDLYVFAQSRSLPEIAAEEATFAAITPFRDLCGLGDTLLFLVPVTIAAFRLSMDRWGSINDPSSDPSASLPRWTVLCWGTGWLYAMCRFATIAVGTNGFPPGGFGVLETAIVPAFMAMADGVVFACLLVELRRNGLSLGDDHDDHRAGIIDVRSAVDLWPAAVAACVLALPSRYLATAGWLWLPYVPGSSAPQTLGVLLRGWGLVWLQGITLAFVVAIATAAWPGASGVRLLRLQGGRLAAWMTICTALAGLAAGLSYAVMLSMPWQPWLLLAADSYAHYATLLVGLACLSGLVELGSRARPEALPRANPAAPDVSDSHLAAAPLDIDSSADPRL